VGQGLPEPEAHRQRSCRLSTWSSSPHLQRRISSTTPQFPPALAQTPLTPPRNSIRYLGPTLRRPGSSSRVLPNRQWALLRERRGSWRVQERGYLAPCRDFPEGIPEVNRALSPVPRIGRGALLRAFRGRCLEGIIALRFWEAPQRVAREDGQPASGQGPGVSGGRRRSERDPIQFWRRLLWLAVRNAFAGSASA
jgi:hypothetical protein